MTVALVPQRGVLRALRGSALAVASALLAATAHVAAGGPVPDGAVTAALALLIAAAGTALADRRRGPLALIAAVGITQVLLHLVLDAVSGHAHGLTVSADMLGMAAAHAAAAVLTALLLAGAESAVFTVAAAWRRIAAAVPLRVAPALTPPRRPVLPHIPCALPVALQVLLAVAAPRRGPPVSS